MHSQHCLVCNFTDKFKLLVLHKYTFALSASSALSVYGTFERPKSFERRPSPPSFSAPGFAAAFSHQSSRVSYEHIAPVLPTPQNSCGFDEYKLQGWWLWELATCRSACLTSCFRGKTAWKLSLGICNSYKSENRYQGASALNVSFKEFYAVFQDHVVPSFFYHCLYVSTYEAVTKK